jgi:thymidylate synthase ThyX
MSISAKIITDSINSATDDRLTTWILTYPRFIHSEFMTHRMLSRNAASTRAIPTKKIIGSIVDNPAMPVFWGKNQSGMQAVEELDNIVRERREYFEGGADYGITAKFTEKELAEHLWLLGRGDAIHYVEQLLDLGLHKQIAGRLLEPWFNITVLVSGTEWENFFALRAHKDAQPEFRVLAEMMLEEYNKSLPEIKNPCGLNLDVLQDSNCDHEIYTFKFQKDWHIPFGDKMPKELTQFQQLKIAIARAARLSYLTFDGEANIQKDFEIYDKLLSSQPLHTSPAEHPAFPIKESKFVGNFKGWYPFRKLLPNENAKDSRLIKRRVKNGKVE